MRNKATSTLERRVTRVCLIAEVRDFFGGLNHGDFPAFRAETIRDSCNSSLQVFAKRTHALGAGSKFRSPRSPRLRVKTNYQTKPTCMDRRFEDLRSWVVLGTAVIDRRYRRKLRNEPNVVNLAARSIFVNVATTATPSIHGQADMDAFAAETIRAFIATVVGTSCVLPRRPH